MTGVNGYRQDREASQSGAPVAPIVHYVKVVPSTFNARAETAHCLRSNRCIVPASGYYERRAIAGGKQPYFISAADGSVLAIAGLWDQWNDPNTGDAICSCTLIVTAAIDITRRIHDRMPVLFAPRDYEAWLAGEAGVELLRPAPNRDRAR